MKLKLIVAAALISIGGAALAQTTPTTFSLNRDMTTTSGLLTTTNLPIFPSVYVGTNNPAQGAFTDRWNFTFPTTGALASANTISITIGDSSITGLGLRLFSLTGTPAANGSLQGLGLGTLLGTGTSTSAGITLNNIALTPGQRYAYVVSGTDVSSTNGGFYTMTASASPVPEPETYALFLAGLAAVGFVARRRAPTIGMAPAAA